MRLVLLGPPGSGKGTQGRLLAEHLGVPHLSTGDLLRRHAARGTDLGRRIASWLDKGELVPDDLALAAMREAMAEADDTGGYVLDGFPRTVAQARAADAAGPRRSIADAVVHLDIPDEVARERLAGRAAGEGRADDARPDVIEHRIELYHAETEPLLEHYRARGLLVTVDGTGPPEEIAAAIQAVLADRVGRG